VKHHYNQWYINIFVKHAPIKSVNLKCKARFNHSCDHSNQKKIYELIKIGFTVRRGKVLSCGGCESHPTPVAPVGSGLMEVCMKRYIVKLKAKERTELEAITQKGSHRSWKVINALILLNCDKSEHNECCTTGAEIASVLLISMHRVDRVKKRFVEDGIEAALGNLQGRRAKYLRKADGEFEARLIALSCSDPPKGHA